MAFFHVMPESGKKIIPISSQTLSKLSCSSCTLDEAKLKHPKMLPTGSDEPIFYFMGEAPGETEDEEGEQFVGLTGQMIRSRIPSKYKSKIRWNNTIRCRPPSNRTPSRQEIECCRRLQVADIVGSKPLAVVGFGGVPLHWMIEEDGIRDVWRGRRVAVRLEHKGKHHDFWYYALWHPSFVNRMGGNSYRGSDWGDVFAADLKWVFDEVETLKPPRIVTPEELRSNINCWKPGDDIDSWGTAILGLCRDNSIGLDIETTGYMPYADDAKILTASISAGEKQTIAFPLEHPEARMSNRENLELWWHLRVGLLSAKRVIAQNAPFEQEWLTIRGKRFTVKDIHAIKWADSLGQAYTLDERKGCNSLDHLTLINFGVRVKSLSDVDTSNLINEPLSKVLPYNGMDSKSCRMVWYAQKKRIIKEGLVEVSNMHERRSVTMALLMSRGLHPNWPAIKEFHGEFTDRIEKIEKSIDRIPEVREFKRSHEFNPGTPEDVKKVLVHLGYDVDDTREETLSDVRHPFAKAILEWRQISTLQTRYIVPLLERKHVQPDGLIHARSAFFGATDDDKGITSTGRLAYKDPNMQNFPKRENREVRRVICAPKDHYIASFDFGQIEFRVIGMCSKDKKVVDACWTDYDVHGYWLDKIVEAYPRWKRAKGMAEDKAKYKTARDVVKNGWVFPAFFLSQLISRAGYLGIPEDYLVEVDEEFWRDFSGVKTWHERLMAEYAKLRYVQTLTGRRRHWGRKRPLTTTEIANQPVQGTAADICLDAMERLDAASIEYEEPWLAPHLQVHDDLTFYIPKKPRIFEDAVDFIGEEMCKPTYGFINVPLKVELSVGETWDDLQEIHVFNSKDYGMRRTA